MNLTRHNTMSKTDHHRKDKSNTSSNHAAPSSFQHETTPSQNHENSQTSLAKSENSIEQDNRKTNRSNKSENQSKASSVLSQSQQSSQSQSNGSSKIPIVKSKVTESEIEIEASSKQVEKLLIKELEAQEGLEDAISNNKDHSSDTQSLQNSKEGSNKTWDGPDKNFSLGLPPIKRKKFPYYKYGLIIPKCKSIISETQRKKKEKCLDGPWSNTLKDFYKMATENAKIPETPSEVERKKRVRKTVAQADYKMSFKMAEIQNLFGNELQELKQAFERLKKEPDALLAKKIEDEWTTKKKQIQQKIEECIDEILIDIKDIFYKED